MEINVSFVCGHSAIYLYPRSPEGEEGILFYLCPSVRPRYFLSHFSQQLSMAEIWYLVTSFIYVCHIVGSVFGPVRFLLPVCQLCWFYTHLTYMHIFRRIFLTKYWWQESDIWSQASYTFRYAILWEAVFFVKSAIFDTSKLCKCQHIERVTILKFFDLLYVHKVICTSQYSIVYLLTL